MAEDIAAKGEASPAYAKAKAAMDAGTKFSMKLTDGQTLKYRIIGINHDDLADGSGKAGLTFLTTSTGIRSQMNATKMNEGGWEKSDLRRKMNSGEIWNLMPSEFKSKVKPVTKLTNNINGDYTGRNVTATSDRLFLLSCYEIVPQSYGWGTHYPWTFSEGFQYEAFKDKVSGSGTTNDCLNIGVSWCERTVYINSESTFSSVWSGSGHASYSMYASDSLCVCPAWCF